MCRRFVSYKGPVRFSVRGTRTCYSTIMASENNKHEYEIVNNPGNVTSYVWKSFGFLKKKDSDGIPYISKEKAACKLCPFTTNYNTNTTNLSNHLKAKHPEVLPKSGSNNKNTPITSHFTSVQKLPKNGQRAQAITSAITEYIIDDLCPLSTIESEPFRKLLHTLEPRYDPMSRKYVSETLLPKMYEHISQQIKCEVSKITDYAMTHDMWTSCATESYGTITCHYITEAWELRSLVLQTRATTETHSGENIAEDLNKATVEWDLEAKNTPAITTDNAANELKAIRLLGWIQISCMGHNINLAVRAALDLPRVRTVIARGRNQVTFFHNSPLATTVLLDKQIVLPESAHGHKLIQDVKTRWNSTYDMLERLLEQVAAIHGVTCDLRMKKQADKLKNNLFSSEEQKIAECLVELLQPLKKATQLMSADTYPTLSSILPTISKIEKLLKEEENDLPCIKSMKSLMSKNLGHRNRSPQATSTIQIATILDPRMKSMKFLAKPEREIIKGKLIDQATVTVNQQQRQREQQPSDSDETGDAVVKTEANLDIKTGAFI